MSAVQIAREFAVVGSLRKSLAFDRHKGRGGVVHTFSRFFFEIPQNFLLALDFSDGSNRRV
jgi:hypothetical protein